MDDLRPLAVFAAAVEAGSFAGAARALGMSRSAVSKHVATLEERHGVRLLHRTTRRLRLTDAGERLFPRCADMLSAARAGLDDLQAASDTPTGVLRVTAPAGLAAPLVAPVLARMLDEHPALSAELQVADEVLDLVEAGIDVAIRAGRLADSALVARPIAPLPLLLCASAEYLSRLPAPDEPADLADHEWIAFGPLASRAIALEGPTGRVAIRPAGRVAANHGDSLLALIRAGAGVALVPRFSVADALERGELVEVLPGWRPPAGAVYAVYPPNPFVPPKVRTFIDLLVEDAAGA